jgi:hypothetical protein
MVSLSSAAVALMKNAYLEEQFEVCVLYLFTAFGMKIVLWEGGAELLQQGLQ